MTWAAARADRPGSCGPRGAGRDRRRVLRSPGPDVTRGRPGSSRTGRCIRPAGPFRVGAAGKTPAAQRVVPMTANGGPGLALVEPDGTASLLGALTVAEGRILRVDLLVAPAKLARVRFTSGPRG